MLKKIRELLGLESIPLEELRTERNRPTWNESYLLDALWWSLRSHDYNTQCGCVLAAEDNTPLSFGYNGFIRNIDDSALPNMRPSYDDSLPSKYDFMIHAEHNAILNCVRQGKSTLGATAYITGMPCNWCLQYMHQAGIKRIVYSNFNDPAMIKNEKFKSVQKVLLNLINKNFYTSLPQWYMRGELEMCFVPASHLRKSVVEEFVEKFQMAQAKS